jgi:hypothetical protein
MLTLNAEGLMQKVGLAAAAIKSGERKDMGSPFRQLTPEERAIFQSVIDDLHRQFVAKLVERRKIPQATARTLADGRIYTAEQALANKLIDRDRLHPDALAVAAAPPASRRRAWSCTSDPRVPRDVLRALRSRGRRVHDPLAARRARRRRTEVPVPLVRLDPQGERAAPPKPPAWAGARATAPVGLISLASGLPFLFSETNRGRTAMRSVRTAVSGVIAVAVALVAVVVAGCATSPSAYRDRDEPINRTTGVGQRL